MTNIFRVLLDRNSILPKSSKWGQFMLPKNDQVVEKNGFGYWIMKIYNVKSHLKFFQKIAFGDFCINKSDQAQGK